MRKKNEEVYDVESFFNFSFIGRTDCVLIALLGPYASIEYKICAAIWWIHRQLLLEHFSDAESGPSSFTESVADCSRSTFDPLLKLNF